jgi:hypothetical protein
LQVDFGGNRTRVAVAVYAAVTRRVPLAPPIGRSEPRRNI